MELEVTYFVTIEKVVKFFLKCLFEGIKKSPPFFHLSLFLLGNFDIQKETFFYICLVLIILKKTMACNKTFFPSKRNKPNRATMRPDCDFACIDHVTCIERQIDNQMGKTTE